MLKIKPLESILDLNVNIQEAIHSIPISNRYFIALSGGLDSFALLYFCLPYLKLHTDNIHVIHINHGLSPNANVWAEFCQEICANLGVVCHIEQVSVVSEGKGVEAAARKARYEVFSRYLVEGGILLQGHHLNDQAETVLMRVFKGLGPEAIKGIPQQRSLSSGYLYRPWLTIPRELLLSSAQSFGLTWVEDESNLDIRFERNFLRHNVLPMLKQRRPSILSDLGRTAQKSKESVEFIEEWCEANKHDFLSSNYSQYQAVNISQLTSFSKIQQKFILRFWFDLLGISHPSESSFNRIFDELLLVKSDKQAEVCWNENVLRVFNDALFCLPRSLVNVLQVGHRAAIKISLNELNGALYMELPGGKLSLKLVKETEIDSYINNKKKNKMPYVFELFCNVPDSISELTLRYRSGGEKIYLNQEHSTSLKKLYQTKKVLPWLRDKLPLIYSKDEMLCSMAGFVAYSCQFERNNNQLVLNNKSVSSKKLLHFQYEVS